MTPTEDLLRDVLRDEAGAEPHGTPDLLADIRARGAGRRRRRTAVRAVGGAGILSAAAAVLVVLLAGGSADDARQVETVPPATQPDAPTPSSTLEPGTVGETPPATGSTDDGTSAAGPGAAVAITDDNRVVVVDTRTGAEVRELFRGSPPDPKDPGTGDLGGLSVSADGATVWFHRSGHGCANAGTIYRVPVGGGEAEAVAEGEVPAISADGSQLAYADRRGADECAGTLVVRDVETGGVTEWRQGGDDANPWAISAIAWAPDGRSLAIEMGSDASGIGILDLTVDESLDDLSGLPVGGPNGAPAWSPDGQDLYATTWCCGDFSFDPASAQIVRVHLADGAVEEVARPGAYVEALDVDASGRWLLYVADGQLFALDADGTATPLGRGYTDAPW